MKRSFNWLPWLSFVIALVAVFSYVTFFIRFPVTRNFPWVNLLLFLAAGIVLAIGLRRAFAQPEKYRGRISGIVLGTLTLGLFGLFCFGIFYTARNIPSGSTALHVGERAPDFTLQGADGQTVTLARLLQGNRAALLIFYRGYW